MPARERPHPWRQVTAPTATPMEAGPGSPAAVTSPDGAATNASLAAHLAAPLPPRRHASNAVLGVVLGALCLLTVVMNILVLLAIRRERALHTVGNLYIVSLSLADLVVGATVMPLSLVYLLEDEWRLGRALCQFWLVMDYVASTASIFSLFILCLDRYRSVRQPLRYLKYRTRGRAALMIGGAWLLSLTWVAPILGWRAFARVDRRPELESRCDTDFRFVTWFKVVTAILNFYVPSLLMLWFYSQIFVSVRQHYKRWESVTIARVALGGDRRDPGRPGMPRGSAEDVGGPRGEEEEERREGEEEEDLAPRAFSRGAELLDRYMLEQPCDSREAGEEEEKEDKPRPRRTSFFKIAKRRRKASWEPDEISSVGPGDGMRVPQHPEDPHLKMLVSVNDCNVLVPNSVADVREVPGPSWGPGEDGGSTPTLRQTWQRFCEQSRQCVQNMRVHKERKAARQLGFIIGAFMVCWIPYFITFMVMALCDTCVHHDLHMFTIWLGYINSTLNPFIYPLCNENFKRVFKKIFRLQK